MHEYSIVSALLDRVEREAAARGASSVAAVRVALGEQSGVEPELLRSAFELARSGTVCGDAELTLRTIAVRWECPRCRQEPPPAQRLRCGECGAPARLAAGDEILLERLELEVA